MMDRNIETAKIMVGNQSSKYVFISDDIANYKESVTEKIENWGNL